MSTQGVFREWMNGYLFILDVFAIGVLFSYVLQRDSKYYDGGVKLAFGLLGYLVGHAINRFWVWNWWREAPDSDSVWTDLYSLLNDPTLLISICFITAGLMCTLRVLLGAFVGYWAWFVALCVAAVLPILISVLR